MRLYRDGILHRILCSLLWPTGYWPWRHSCSALWSHGGPAESHRHVFPASPEATVLCSAGDICELETGSGLCGFLWEILVWTAVVVFIVKSQHTLRREKVLANSFAAPIIEYGRVSENIGLMAQARETLLSPVAGASLCSYRCCVWQHLIKSRTGFHLGFSIFSWKKTEKWTSTLLFPGPSMVHFQRWTWSLEDATKGLQTQVIEQIKEHLKTSEDNGEQLWKKETMVWVKTRIFGKV